MKVDSKTSPAVGAPSQGGKSGSATPKPEARGVASTSEDGFELGGIPKVQVRGAQGPQDLQGTIASEFPLSDLSKIPTHGRWSTGFRLDSGSVRFLWVSARRFADQDGKPKFELFFFAQGDAVERVKEHLKKDGNTVSAFPYVGFDVDPAAPDGASRLKQTTATWSQSAEGVRLIEEGSFDFTLCTSSPEALKGAMRIVIEGDDAEATKTLKKVVDRFGLQDMFAPPTPLSLERYKLARLAFSTDPAAARRLSKKFFDELEPSELDELLDGLESDKASQAVSAHESVDMNAEPLRTALRLGHALFERDTERFFTWLASPGTGPTSLAECAEALQNKAETLLSELGVEKDSDAMKALASAELPDAALGTVLKLAELGRLASKDATAYLDRPIENVGLDRLRAQLDTLGIDASSERLERTTYQEVYPGFFTLVDPARAQQFEEAGACYLYSTSDTPERTLEMLQGGQKSSLTRMQEGALVTGKSSGADYNSGGALSVFSRLVTRSAVQAAKTGSSNMAFRDWGGSRPFKLILNRRVLARLDWYGYNGDNYGRTTNLKSDNFGEKIIRTIDGSYSSSNELMFPVGNDPSFVDFVVCSTDAQKKKLIEAMEKAGYSEFNGRPLEKFVRVEKVFFEHPDDMTLDRAIRDALERLTVPSELEQEVTAKIEEIAESSARPAMEAHVETWVGEELEDLTQSDAAQRAVNSARAHLKGRAMTPPDELAGGQLTSGLETFVKQQAAERVEALLEDAFDKADGGAVTSQVQSDVRGGVQDMKDELEAQFDELFEQAKGVLDESEPPSVRKKKLRPEMRRLIIEAFETKAITAGRKAVSDEGVDLSKEALVQRARMNIEIGLKKDLREPIVGHAMALISADAIQSEVDAMCELGLELGVQSAKDMLTKDAAKHLRSRLRPRLVEAAEGALGEKASELALPLAVKGIATAMKDAGLAAAEAFLADTEGELDSEAKGLVEELVQSFAQKTAEDLVQKKAKAQSPQVVSKVAGEILDQQIETLGDKLPLDKAEEEGKKAILEAFTTSVSRTVTDFAGSFLNESIEGLGADEVEAYAETNKQAFFDQVVEATVAKTAETALSALATQFGDRAVERYGQELEAQQ